VESIVDHLERQAAEGGSRPFLTEGSRTLSFGDTLRWVRQTAAALLDHGVRPGERVALLIHGRTEHLVAHFAAMSLGAIPVHLDATRVREFVEFAAVHTGARLLLTRQCAEDWRDFPCPVLAFPELDADATEACPRDRSEIAYMMFTSGTTGRPKAVMTSHANLLFTANTIIGFAGLTPGHRELISMPLAFTFGLGHVHAQTILGGQARLHGSNRDMPALLNIMANDGITGFLASPGMLKTLIERHGEEFAQAGRGLRYIVVNCTPMPAELTERLLRMLPHAQVFMYYGLTEASRSAFNHYNANPNRLAATGKATRGIDLRIANPDAETGAGEVCIKGPNVMLGYWGSQTRAGIDEDGWFHTGDLAVMDGEGFITVAGRVNDQISVDGMKCQPLEVEEVLNRHRDVSDSAVVALPDADSYQTVGAAVVARPGSRSSADDIREYCRRHLEPFKVPRTLVVVDEIPKNELGKIKRVEVRSLILGQTQSSVS
jgi:long-chain acyl-CoA synthetase